MKKNFSFSSKMHLFIIISCILVAVAVAIGLVCQFASDGFFNLGADYSSYRSVTVCYYDKVMSTDEVEELCDGAFDSNGVNYYTKVYASDVNNGSEIEYRFSKSQDSAAIEQAVADINASDKLSGYVFGSAYYESAVEAKITGAETLMWAGIAAACAIVFQFLYFVIRYKLLMACAAFIADIHNLALFLALLVITRIEISSSVFALGVFTIILTMIGCAVLFDRMRKNFRTDEYKAMPSFAQSDAASSECLPLVTTMHAVIAAVTVILAVFGLISAMSFSGMFMPCIAALVAVLVCEYGTMFFTPSVYSRFKLKADVHAENKAKKGRPGYSKPKKKEKAAAEGSAE